MFVSFLSAPVALFQLCNTKYQYHTEDSVLYCLDISFAKEISKLLKFRQILRMRAEELDSLPRYNSLFAGQVLASSEPREPSSVYITPRTPLTSKSLLEQSIKFYLQNSTAFLVKSTKAFHIPQNKINEQANKTHGQVLHSNRPLSNTQTSRTAGQRS